MRSSPKSFSSARAASSSATNVTTPGLLDALNDLGFAYRWMTRSAFLTETDRALDLLTAILPEVRALSDAETLSYLHGAVSEKAHDVAVPQIPAYLDAVLCDTPLTGGVEPKLGRQHLRILTVLGFPSRPSARAASCSACGSGGVIVRK
jgi:hypothetical protein